MKTKVCKKCEKEKAISEFGVSKSAKSGMNAKCKRCSWPRAESVQVESLDGEVWMPVVGYEGLYEVSGFGRVLSMERTFINSIGVEVFSKNKLLKLPISNSGYKRAYLYINGKSKPISVHRLVAQAFLPNPEGKRCVNHKDGDRMNCAVDNLEWVSNSENDIHAFKNGLRKPRFGIKNNFSKLTEDIVLKIRNLKGTMSHKKIGECFGVTPSNVTQILNRKTWNHI